MYFEQHHSQYVLGDISDSKSEQLVGLGCDKCTQKRFHRPIAFAALINLTLPFPKYEPILSTHLKDDVGLRKVHGI